MAPGWRSGNISPWAARTLTANLTEEESMHQKSFHCNHSTQLCNAHNQLFFIISNVLLLHVSFVAVSHHRINHWIPHQRCHTRQIATFPDLPQRLITPNQTVTVCETWTLSLSVWCWSCNATSSLIACLWFVPWYCNVMGYQWSLNSINRGTNDQLKWCKWNSLTKSLLLCGWCYVRK